MSKFVDIIVGDGETPKGISQSLEESVNKRLKELGVKWKILSLHKRWHVLLSLYNIPYNI